MNGHVTLYQSFCHYLFIVIHVWSLCFGESGCMKVAIFIISLKNHKVFAFLFIYKVFLDR